MILVTGTFRIAPERLADARRAMERMILASRAEAGCLSYAYAEDLLEPGLIRVHECWSDQEALDRHFAWAHITQWRAAWPALGITDRDLSAFHTGEARAT